MTCSEMETEAWEGCPGSMNHCDSGGAHSKGLPETSFTSSVRASLIYLVIKPVPFGAGYMPVLVLCLMIQ